MDLWTIIKVVVRRWYAVLPVLLLTAAFAFQVNKAPPSYEANGSALLVAPNSTTGATGATVKQNSFLIFSGSLNITASAVSRVLNDTATRSDYFESGLLPDYEIGADPSIPLIGVTATGTDPDVVIGTVKRVLVDVSEQLKTLQDQADAPTDARIGVRELVNPSVADSLRGNVGRTMATVAALGLLLAVAVALTIEGIATRKRPGYQAAPHAVPVVPPAAAATPAYQPAAATAPLQAPAPAPAPAYEAPAAAVAPLPAAAAPAYAPPAPAHAPMPAPAYEPPAAASASAAPTFRPAAAAPAYPHAVTARADHPANDRMPRPLGAVAEQPQPVNDDDEEEEEALPAPLPFRRNEDRSAHPGRPLTAIDGGAEGSAGERRVHPFVAAQRRAMQSEQDG